MFNQITPLVKNLLIVNVLMFVLQQMSGGLATQYLSLFDFRSEYFMPHQIITYMFLHGGMGHLFFNMLWLFFMGPVLERFLGDKKFFILYMVSGIGAGILQLGANYIQNPEVIMFSNGMTIFDVPTLGASGAVAGIMMAVALLFPNTEIYLYMMFPVKLKYFAAFYVVSELYSGLTGSDPGIAHFAHLGGMLFGFILIKIWNQNRHNFY